MNVLICGKNDGFCKQLSDRLHREKHDVYYISGNKRDKKLCDSVFQEYHFPYLNENIDQIMISANPDVMIIMGAYDRNYAWRNPEKDSAEFSTGMMRLFMSAQSAGVKKLIYISTTEVYELNTEEKINSSVSPYTTDTRLLAYLKTEDIAKNLKKLTVGHDAMEIIVVRLPLIFGDWHNDTRMDVCLRFASNYMTTNIMPVVPGICHSAIYFADATEAVMQCMKLESSEEIRLLQIKGLVFSEEELAEAFIAARWNKKCSINLEEIEDDDNETKNYPPTRITADDEGQLKFRLRYDLKTSCNLLCKAYLRLGRIERRKSKDKLNVIPIIESVAAGILTYFASAWLADTWVADDLNLFPIYTIIFAVAYGTTHGLFAAIIAGLGTLLLMQADSSFVTVICSFNFYIRFWQLVLMGVIAGWVRDKYKRKNKALTEENSYLSSELQEVTLINDNNAYIKNVYEKRIVGYRNSLSRIYELSIQLDFMESQKVVFQAVRMVSDLMEMPDVAIYIAGKFPRYLRLAAATSELASSCGGSLKFDEESYLYDDLSNKRIFLNREVIEGRPTFAGAIYSDAQLRAIILVWTSDIRQVNLYFSDMLAISCKMIEKSINRAVLYESSLSDSRYEKGLNLMTQDAFLKMLSIFEDGSKQGLLSFVTLAVELKGHTYAEASKMVRDTDYIGVVGEIPYVILSNTKKANVEIVQKRFRENGMEAHIVESDHLIESEANDSENEMGSEETLNDTIVETSELNQEISMPDKNNPVNTHGTASVSKPLLQFFED